MVQLLLEKDHIRDLLANYCFYTDACLADKWLDLFVEDAIWDGGPSRCFEGKAALKSFIETEGRKAFGLKHVNSNPVITVDGTQAYVRSYLVVYANTDAGDQSMFAGHYFDHLVKHENRWLFKSRKLRADLTEMPTE